MIRLLAFILLAGLLVTGCASRNAPQGGARAPGGGNAAAHGSASGRAAGNGFETITTPATDSNATNAAAGASGNSPGGSIFGGGIGTGQHGALFWFYVALGVAFLVWLILAIWHRRNRRHEMRAEPERQVKTERVTRTSRNKKGTL